MQANTNRIISPGKPLQLYSIDYATTKKTIIGIYVNASGIFRTIQLTWTRFGEGAWRAAADRRLGPTPTIPIRSSHDRSNDGRAAEPAQRSPTPVVC